jgi:DNA polymerase-1
MKILSTYVDPILQLSKTGDGVIRTSFIQTGTTTGRFSSEKPNLQNIPQESKWAKSLRDCFVSRKGKSLVSFDYSQLELRILAHVSNDTTLKEAFIQKKDIHTLTAQNVFNVSEDAVTPHMRRMAKTLNFGVIYGMGARAFSEESGISKDAARIFIQEYFSDFPAVSEWREKTKKFTEEHGYVRNENGRVRYFPYSKKNPRAAAEFERAAVNMPIQSLEADIIKLAMRDTFESVVRHVGITACAPLLTIHDELIFEISDDILKETAPRIKTVMESVYPLSVPLLVEPKYGKAWGSMEKF